jgi:hypothetical protein
LHHLLPSGEVPRLQPEVHRFRGAFYAPFLFLSPCICYIFIATLLRFYLPRCLARILLEISARELSLHPPGKGERPKPDDQQE